MALQRSMFVLLASTARTSLAAELPPAGRVAQAVGPDGALTQADGGVGQRARSYPAPYPSYASPPVAAAPYPSSAPMVPVSTASGPSAAAPAAAGPPCIVPMWGEDQFVCKEHNDYMMASWTDSQYRVRTEMPDGTKCTVMPPEKMWSFWMGSEVTEMTCKAGVWVDGKGAPVTAIEMKTAQWFLIASAVTAAVLAYVLYKSLYDAQSSWYKWRLDTAIKLGFAKPAPVVEQEDKGGDTAPQPAINISIANQSSGQPK